MAQQIKNLPAMQETRDPGNVGLIPGSARSLGQQDPWRRELQPTPVFLFEKSHGQRVQQATVQRVSNSAT